MTQEQKDLLLKDLSARLPYGVKFPMMCWDEKIGETIRPVTLYSINQDGYCHVSEDDYSPYIDEVKPYLFPMSSMTEEQRCEYHGIIGGMFGTSVFMGFESLEDFFRKNHLDYRGLIPMGLAEDATGLDIY